MLSVKEARKIGIDACIEKIGNDFWEKHKDFAVYSYGETEGYKVSCFVGISDQPQPDWETEPIRLSPGTDWPYYAECDVDRKTGEVEFDEFVVPEG